MAEKLTPQQQEAVTNRGGNLLVSAAAGSGKTKVLVDRLLSYLKDPVNPANLDEFLLITYTKAAASELRAKIAAKLSEAVAEDPENRHLQQQMRRLYLTSISTVHAFCGDLLREYAYRLDICGDFRVADETECAQLQQSVIEELLENAYITIDEDHYFRAFTDTQGFGRDDSAIPDLILKVYNSARCHLNPDQWLDWCLSAADMTGITDASKTVWGRYLVDDIRSYLALQISALESCIERASKTDGMEKPLLLLKSTLLQLKNLYSADSWDEIRTGLNVDFGRLVFSKKCGDPELAEQIKAIRNACKKGLEKRSKWFADDSAKVLVDISSVNDSARGLIALVKKFSVTYDKRKRAFRILDFGDLEHRTLDLLLGKKRSGPTAIAAEVGQRFREVMVDEYQDSNAVQDAIFTALTSKKQNCFMVGDVKQSIYQFRLADPEIFLDKYNRFAPASEAEEGSGRKVMLSSNFRSSGGVISAVNDVFATCMSEDVGGLAYGKDEALYEGFPHSSLGEPEVELHGVSVIEDTYGEEAAYVANRISQLIDGTHMVRDGENLRPIIPDDIVILLRSPGSVGNDFLRALHRCGIPCTMGGSVDLLQTEEVSLLHALLQIIDNPLQDIPMLAVLTSRLFCFTADNLAAFRKQDRKSDIFSAMKSSKIPKIQSFLQMLENLRAAARIGKLSDVIATIFAETRIDSIYSALSDGNRRLENLQAFCRIADNSEANGVSDLSRFLEQLDAMSKKGLTVQGQETAEGSVTIMSIHKSKGLEFPVVFLCGLSREFNRESLRAAVLCDKELGIGLSCVDSGNRIRYPSLIKSAISVKIQRESVSEEMRVLYVAMTRARDRLVMTYASRNLENELTEIALRMELSKMNLLTSEADCPGAWVLLTAMRRTEAGAFFALSGPVSSARLLEPAWKIQVAEAQETVECFREDHKLETLSAATVKRLSDGLSFQYPYQSATQTPSKQTATQLKGREKDKEAAEFTNVHAVQVRNWRKPSFVQLQSDGRSFGNAVHAVMQHIHLDSCSSAEKIHAEIKRLEKAGLIPPEYSQQIDCGKLETFFTSELGQKIRNGKNVIREFKFSVLIDGDRYGHELAEEKILLQGVVDFALVEEDGITILDYKTDKVTDNNLTDLIAMYKPQIDAYADALSRIYRLPVKLKQIFFFSVGKFVSL